eukprot:jgi/Botrbrau1/524/Bobra.110_2s0152.1
MRRSLNPRGVSFPASKTHKRKNLAQSQWHIPPALNPVSVQDAESQGRNTPGPKSHRRKKIP